jgi:oxygen-independent coproporphyrinogen III oxidase
MTLIAKYNVAAPRYTSYPTVPAWRNVPTGSEWCEAVKETFSLTNAKDGISLYIHLPFCESLCTYCACNTRITVNHKVEIPYIKALVKEWGLYLNLFGAKPRLKELHLGGGTPTFFHPHNLQLLIESILATVEVPEGHDYSFEGHPSNTTREHLQVLYDLGFRRVSFGVQDFNEKVQEAINRYQSFEQVKKITETARRVGYDSVNFDLVYGLPFQTLESVTRTIEKVNLLAPDRIAFYSYAHVPWIRPGQRKFSENDLPAGEEKLRLYTKALEMFADAGYGEVGMDLQPAERRS